MADLEAFLNIYGDLAQGAYVGRENNLPYYSQKDVSKKILDKNESLRFEFPGAKDAHGNDASTVYLQPNKTVKNIIDKIKDGKEKFYKNYQGERMKKKKKIVVALVGTGLLLTAINWSKIEKLIYKIEMIPASKINEILDKKNEDEKEHQIAFLKEHEEEMVAFIKKYSSEDEDITFHWETTEVSADVPFSAPVLLVDFDISNSSEPKYNDNGYTISIGTNVKKLDKIYDIVVLYNIINENYQEEKNGKSRVEE